MFVSLLRVLRTQSFHFFLDLILSTATVYLYLPATHPYVKAMVLVSLRTTGAKDISILPCGLNPHTSQLTRRLDKQLQYEASLSRTLQLVNAVKHVDIGSSLGNRGSGGIDTFG